MREVNYNEWNPEAKALLASCVSWLMLHGMLVDFNKAFVWSWAAHWLINGVWGFSYLWRTGSYGHRMLLFRQTWGAPAVCTMGASRCEGCGSCPCGPCTKPYALSCRTCGAKYVEPCDAGLHG